MEGLADALRREMERLGLTEHRAAKKAGIAQPTLHGILNGSNPKSSTLAKLLAGFPRLRKTFQAQVRSSKRNGRDEVSA